MGRHDTEAMFWFRASRNARFEEEIFWILQYFRQKKHLNHASHIKVLFFTTTACDVMGKFLESTASRHIARTIFALFSD